MSSLIKREQRKGKDELGRAKEEAQSRRISDSVAWRGKGGKSSFAVGMKHEKKLPLWHVAGERRKKGSDCSQRGGCPNCSQRIKNKG